MLRLKYKLYNGTQPQDAIVAAVPSIDQATDLFMGQWPSGDWMYGEIDTSSENQSTLESALTNWEGTFLTDQQALDYVDSVLPTDTVVVKRVTALAAEIDGNGNVVKQVVEEA